MAFEFDVFVLPDLDSDSSDEAQEAIEQLVEDLNELGEEGWSIASIQGQFVFLQREIDGEDELPDEEEAERHALDAYLDEMESHEEDLRQYNDDTMQGNIS